MQNQNELSLRQICEDLKINWSEMPSQSLENGIKQVLVVNPDRKCLISVNNGRTTTGTTTIYTLPADRDFYLNDCYLSFEKNAACDATGVLLRYTLENGETDDLFLSTLALTASSMQLSRSFPKGIKLKRGSTISLILNFTAGAMTASAGASGYVINTL